MNLGITSRHLRRVLALFGATELGTGPSDRLSSSGTGRFVKRTLGIWAASALVVAGVAAAPSVSATDDARVRVQPGTIAVLPGDQACTMGFVLSGTRPEDGELFPDVAEPESFFVIAGHCLVVGDTSQSWPSGTGPEISDSFGPVGRAVFAAQDLPTGVDIAIIEATVADNEIDPAVCYWGGPTGLAEDRAEPGERLLMTGVGLQLRPRELTATEGQTLYTFYQGPTITGDSGAPVLDDDGRALAVHARGGLYTPDLATGAGSHLPNGLALAGAALGYEFDVVTAPLIARDWPTDAFDVNCGGLVTLP